MNLQTVKQRFGIIGRSLLLDSSLERAVKVSPTDLTVLITGESGVGKEVFSRIIHDLSPRKHNKFIAINCGAIPEGTIYSELFGHAKGAFTGATSDRKGYFETVNGGTIFLDEIGELPFQTQSMLLRVLEQGTFIRMGDTKEIHTDIRVIAATNVDFSEKIQKGKFRDDLYYRLSTVRIQVPSLKERKEDIYLLFRKFAVDFAEKYRSAPIQLDEQAQKLLEAYRWPGNVRELKNLAEQISVLTEERMVGSDELAEFLPNAGKRHLPILSKDLSDQQDNNGYHEREIMYKFLADMKKDLNDLKTLVVELIRTNNLRMPSQLDGNNSFSSLPSLDPKPDYSANEYRKKVEEDFEDENPSRPIIINSDNTYKDVEEVEESLSLEEMEKDFIQKALKKHRGHRKGAAAELGISERTLYRKIKQYNIKE